MFVYKLLVLFNVVNFIFCDDLTVTTKYGQVKGRIQTMLDNSTYYAWQGIPYAAPPIGKLRFQAPTEPSSWSGVKNTTKNSNVCYQVKSDSPNENEDCLYLNVYVPSNRGSEKLPVLFWIYGGAFRGGSSSFNSVGPDRIIAEGVIVVSHNYRIGPFGFLSTGDTVVPGNAGLKDQAFALKWTFENIAAFGGDPNKIVIAGQSAGSASVGYQLLSTKNQGLFRGAIQQSGSPLNEWSYMSDPKPYVSSLISVIDANATVGTDSSAQLAYLQSLNASVIDAASKSTTPTLTLPVVEPEHDGAFITQKMFEAFAAGNYNKVPVIIGCNSEEDLFLSKSSAYVRQIGQRYDDNPHALLPVNLVTDDSNKDELAAQIKKFYIDGDDEFKSRYDAVIRFGSDSGFTRGAIKQGELMSAFNDVYFYIFSYDGKLGGWNKNVTGAEKVTHGEDLYYIWVHRGTTSNEDLSKYPESDQLTSQRIVKMWTNFAKTLNPTPDNSTLLQGVTWPKVNATNYQYLDIDTDLEVKNTPKLSYPFWKAAYESYGTRPYVTY
ncbi:juvenile hormone esterase-like [Anthonomus grandis grandis]|uniref:juvenile hormone esterase-like n=1 Tax=Anthonomus grandis grandis TaxID=2921223 RepID=UPI0021662231|nr:juvenile hormone esterase-like [Anthonomus grandis grandis]